MARVLQLVLTLVVLTCFLGFGLACVFRPRAIHEYLLASYRKENLLSRIDPFRWWVESDCYPVWLRVCGVISLGMFLFGLGVVFEFIGRRG